MSSPLMRHSLILGAILVGTSFLDLAYAGPTVASVSGASNYTLTGNVTIFGGLSGDTSGCTKDNVVTCNTCNSAGLSTCTKTPLCPCNAARIYDGLMLTIYLSNTTTDANGTTTTTTPTGEAVLTPPNATTNKLNTNTANGGTFIQVPWTTVCNQATTGGGAGCEGLATNGAPSATVTLNLYTGDANGVVASNATATVLTFKILNPDKDTFSTYGSTTSQGIGTFEPYPGDGKVYIKDPQTTTDFPTLNYTSKIVGVRVFISNTNLTDATPASSEFKDLAVTDDGSSLAKNAVDGLTNGTPYYFRLGMLDEAANVVQLTPDPAVDTDAASTACSGGTAGCKYSATPDEVEGLLPNPFNCFIATAAYGSMLDPHVFTFREFRARFLLPHRAGRAFNAWYYTYGPYAADYISDKPALRAVARGFLWPAYGFSWLAVRYGLATALTALLLTLATLITSARVIYTTARARD